MIEGYLIHLLILIGIMMILALSLQLSMGFGGLINLGHIAFYAIGAYTSAILVQAGVPFGAAIIAAGTLAMILGFLVAIPVHRLKGDYLALATMGFAFVTYAVALNWTSFTHGPLGIAGIQKPLIFGVIIKSPVSYLALTWIITFLTYLIIRRITRSPFGKVLEAIRDDELAARCLGKNTMKMKSYCLGISAFFAGIAGSLYAHYISYIDPSTFSVLQIIPVLAIVIIGGLGSLRGTMIATIILVLLPEPLRFIGFPSSIVGPARQLMYAVMLIIILLYKPRGFFGKVQLT